jgi:hypothetical protein
MTVRPLDLLDLPTLSRYRRSVLSLDSARILTRGNPLGAAALLSYLNPRRTIYTALSREDGLSVMGQVLLNEYETSARLTFLAPAEGVDEAAPALLEHLAAQAGDWGAFHVLAEVDEDSPAFPSLRQAGFATYAWQRVWKLPAAGRKDPADSWRPAEGIDWPAIQTLHGQIIPALLLPLETLPEQAAGLVCRPDGNLQAYTALDSGPKGLWLQPLTPPDSACRLEQLVGLLRSVPAWRRCPIYMCVRSYQAWLESALADLGAEAGLRQAVMVKRLAKLQRAGERLSAMEKVLANKPAAPVARVVGNEDIPVKK